MIKSFSAPANLLGFALALAVAMAAAMTFIARDQPYLGLRMAFSASEGGAVVLKSSGPAAHIPKGAVLTQIEGGGTSLTLGAADFTIEPDGAFGPYADYEAFLERQDQLAAIVRQPQVSLADKSGRSFLVTPAPNRPLGSLPADYWIQVSVGVIAFLIAASIWAFRRSETSARYLLLSGVATLMFAPFAAVYTTRELALPSNIFLPLDDLNFLGGSLFAASLAALLLYYPRKLAPRWAGLAIVALFVGWWIAQDMGVFADMAFARRILVLIALLATFVLAGIHWWLTKRDPVARAALKWFLLSWLLGATLFGVAILLPQLFGVDTSAYQGYAFTLFLLVYGGLAFGILRFRLFDLGEWWGRVMLWASSVLILVLFDLLFLFGLNLSAGAALSFALLICGLVWLPLRGWLTGRLLGRSKTSTQALFHEVVGVGFTPPGQQRRDAWVKILQSVFDPLEVGPSPPSSEPALMEQGVGLIIPSVDSIPALCLSYARGGRRLFSRGDLSLAADLVSMLRHVIQSREAYDKGVAMERKRIADDIHDNVGGPLLSALQARTGDRKDELIRESLTDLRGIINDTAGGAADVGEALAELRFETADRLAAAGVQLDWPIPAPGGGCLSSADVHLMRSVIREAISNVIKHAGARHVRVVVETFGADLRINIQDDGRGFDADKVEPGRGLPGIQGRLAMRGGSAVWRPRDQGTELVLELPSAAAQSALS